MSAKGTESLQETQYDFSTWPMYYAPKYLFGSEKLKGFIKGAIGWQFSSLERTTALTIITDKDTGFTTGGGVGASFFFNEKIYLTAVRTPVDVKQLLQRWNSEHGIIGAWFQILM